MDVFTTTPETKIDGDSTNNNSTNSENVGDTDGDEDVEAEDDEPEDGEEAEDEEQGDRDATTTTETSKPKPEIPKKKPRIRKKPKTISDLGDAMDAQLVERDFRTTYTETNFEWKKMAMRWGHGRVMWASFLNEGDLYDKPPSITEELLDVFANKFPQLHDTLNKLQLKEISKIMLAIKRTQGMLDLTELLKDLPRDIVDALHAMTSEIMGMSLSNRTSLNSVTSSSKAYDAFSKFKRSTAQILESDEQDSPTGASLAESMTSQSGLGMGMGLSMRDSTEVKNKARLEVFGFVDAPLF